MVINKVIIIIIIIIIVIIIIIRLLHWIRLYGRTISKIVIFMDDEFLGGNFVNRI